MSLINDALKKAQKQRTGEALPLASLPSVGGESAARIARSSKPGGANALIIWAGAGAGAGVLLLVGGWFALRSTPEDRAQKTESNPTQTAPAQSSGVRPPASESAAPVAFTLPVAPLPAEAKQPAGQTPGSPPGTTVPPKPAANTQSSSSVASTPSSVTPSPPSEPAAPAKAASALKLEPRAIQYIDNIKVAGIRASTTDAKVLMNDRVYRVGSVVEAEMGLKLVGITANSLTFEEERGARYTRTF